MTATTPRRSSIPTVPLVIGLVIALVVAVAVLAVVLSGGDDDGSPAPTAPVEPGGLDPRIPAELVGEVRPVEIEGAALAPAPDSGADPAIGQVPPTLIGEDASGFVHTISPGIDGPVLLVFLAHWCPACNEELPLMVELAEQGRLPDDLNVYAVLTGIDPGRPNFPASKWLADSGWPFASVADVPDVDRQVWTAAEAFGLRSYPYTVLIDGGVVTDRWSGVSTADGLIERLSAGIAQSGT